MPALEWARSPRQANALIGLLAGTGLCLTGSVAFGVLFLLVGAAHLLAEVRH